MVVVPKGKESESAGLHPLLDIGESHLEAISRITPTQLRGRQRFSHVTPTEFIRVCSFALILSALAVYGLAEKAKSDASNLARIHAGQTAVALAYDQIATREALINAFTATPTETPTPTAIETPTPTPTATPQLPTQTPRLIDTPEPLDPNPQFIAEGELSKYIELSTIQTIGEESEKSGYEKMGFSLAFTDLESTKLKREPARLGSFWAIEVNQPVDFQSFVPNTPVYSSNDYAQRVNPYTIEHPVIYVTTQEELKTLRKTEPRMMPTFGIAFPKTDTRLLRELRVSIPQGTEFEWTAKPGNKLGPDDSIVRIVKGILLFNIIDVLPDGAFKEIADMSYFVSVNNKVAIPNGNIASEK